ncbi:MAG: V4R domain-containing protein [Promethearchaeota archaeon]
MFNFDYNTKEISYFCKSCNTNIKFKLPEKILEGKTSFPVTYRYIHGNPIHSVTVYVDKDFKIRGIEHGDSLDLSKELIKRLQEECIEEKLSENPISSQLLHLKFLTAIFKAIIGVVGINSPESRNILRVTGYIVAETYFSKLLSSKSNESIIKQEEIQYLINKLKKFLLERELGEIKNVEIKENLIFFDVYDCFECRGIPKIGDTLCFFNLGFFEKIFELFLKKKIKIEETKCCVNNNQCCSFKITSF